MMLLIINVIFGIVYGAYTLFWMPETLPRYYDENHVCNFAQERSTCIFRVCTTTTATGSM